MGLHAPPYDTQLDVAPKIDWETLTVQGQDSAHVGSTAVKEVIEQVQPILSLHGHIHESRAAVRIGRTLAVNPGSSYVEGTLSGCLIELDGKKKLKNYRLTMRVRARSRDEWGSRRERRQQSYLGGWHMATKAPEQTLFVRKASGLVKGWSTGDGFRYSFFSVNLFLAIWSFAYAIFIPGGSLFWSHRHHGHLHASSRSWSTPA